MGGRFLLEYLLDKLDRLNVNRIHLVTKIQDKKMLHEINFEHYPFDVSIHYVDSNDLSVQVSSAIGDISSDRVIMLHGHDLFIIDYFTRVKEGKNLLIKVTQNPSLLRFFSIDTKILHNVCEEEDFIRKMSLHCTEEEFHSIFPIFPWHFLILLKFFLQRYITKQYIHPTAEVSKWAIIEDSVYIDSEARIFRNAVVKGPAYIGKNVIIGDHTLIRESIVEENSIIGCCMEVARSIVEKNAETHSGYLGDSFIDQNTHLGAGFISANLRFDRKNIWVSTKSGKVDSEMNKLGAIIGEKTEIGVHVAVMPGKLIGKNVIIGPGTIVFKNIDDNKIVYSEIKYVEKDR